MAGTLNKTKQDFIETAVRAKAIQFGKFKLKSGRTSPYFFNVGFFNNGQLSLDIGTAFAHHAIEKFGDSFDIFYGPAYKGISLAISTSIAYSIITVNDKGWVFNRKEEKTHSDKGILVGAKIKDGDRILMLDDVFTTGKTKFEAIELIKSVAEVTFTGLVIAMDRQELNNEGENAIKIFEEKTGISVSSIITAKETFEWLHNREIDGKIYVNDEIYDKFQKYMKLYGVQ